MTLARDARRLHTAGLNDQLYELLKDLLVTRQLAPGQKLSLQTLADRFGVSRSPVHHALTRLAQEGLVTVHPRKGYYVKPLTLEAGLEAYDVRLALELQAAELAIGRATTPELSELRNLMELTLRFLNGFRLTDIKRFVASNQAFHNFQVRLAHNALMSDVYEHLSINLLMLRLLYGRIDTVGDIVSEHVELVEAFEARDLARCQIAIRRHIETGKELVRVAVREGGDML